MVQLSSSEELAGQVVYDKIQHNLGIKRLAHQGSPRWDQQRRDTDAGVEMVSKENFYQPEEVLRKEVGRHWQLFHRCP